MGIKEILQQLINELQDNKELYIVDTYAERIKDLLIQKINEEIDLENYRFEAGLSLAKNIIHEKA